MSKFGIESNCSFMKASILFLLLLISSISSSQNISWQELSNLPEKVTNNAVTTATVNGIPYVYSFSGIDSTKACGKPHLHSFRYNTETDSWETIDPLPDPLGGKIAAGASTVYNKIYIIGGYHVSPSCHETSSKKVHIYNPETNSYVNDGADIPKAIDDHVQAIWRDSLIYVISGWSNTSNVTNVQIYNPSLDEWLIGTPVPNNSQWRVFGASGTIIGDTIYFAGGAGNWNGSSFPPTTTFRKGIINPNDPTDILWEGNSVPFSRGYRMGASKFNGKAIWLGGSDITYNFDGIAYNGSGGVPPLNRITIYNPNSGQLTQFEDLLPEIMDLRGVAKIADNQFIIAGGMEADQAVTNKTFLITIDDLNSTKRIESEPINVYPNPTSNYLKIEKEGSFDVEILNVKGETFLKEKVQGFQFINVSELGAGIYWLKVTKQGKTVSNHKFVKLK